MKVEAKIQPKDIGHVSVGDVVGLTDYTIGGPATDGSYQVPAIDRDGEGYTVTALFLKTDHITGNDYWYGGCTEGGLMV